MVFEVILPNVRWPPGGGVADIGKGSKSLEGAVEHLAIGIVLPAAPRVEGVLKNIPDIHPGSRQENDLNT